MSVVRLVQFMYNHPALGSVISSRNTLRPAHPVLDKKQRINHELKTLGVTLHDFIRPEIREIPEILHDNESVKGLIYGRHEAGRVALVATDRRIVFIDKKPLFKNVDEISFNVVGGISYGKAGLFATITLHTPVNDYKIRTSNWISAKHFIRFIERQCLEV